MEKIEAEAILRESIQPGTPNGIKKTPLPPLPEVAQTTPASTLSQPIKTAPPILPLILPKVHFNQELSAVFPQLSFSLPFVEPLNLFEHLPKDLIASAFSEKERNITPSFFSLKPIDFSEHPTPPQAPLVKEVISHSSFSSASNEPISSPTFTSPKGSHVYFPSLQDLATSSYSDYFDAEIVVSPLEDGKGYVFALTLVPQAGLTLPKIRQHYSFLIDRSNSIQKERLNFVKQSIIKALEELDLEDSFNIIAFDSKIDKMSPAPLPATSSSLRAAKNFLEGIQLGSFFSTTNLCKPLFLTIPSSQDEEIHTAILFTDGESLNKKAVQRELALDWTTYNHGRVSLFAIGVGGDPHLATLDATSALNRGKILYPATKRGIKRKLLKLIKTIRHPIAKNMTATAISRSSAKITLYPKQMQMPILYSNEPYVILGTTDKLDNFILFVQGKIKDQWLNIKKTISFVSAKKGEGSLKAEWALHQAYMLYEQYLSDLDSTHLAEAQALLEPHDLQVAFQ